MEMKNGHAAQTCNMDMKQGHAEFRKYVQHGHAWTSIMDMQDGSE
jgi:hypothetical protein